MGSSIDDFLKQEGIFEEAQAQAVKEVVAWQPAPPSRRLTSRQACADQVESRISRNA